MYDYNEVYEAEVLKRGLLKAALSLKQTPREKAMLRRAKRDAYRKVVTHNKEA